MKRRQKAFLAACLVAHLGICHSVFSQEEE
jgi:hypothetical protein